MKTINHVFITKKTCLFLALLIIALNITGCKEKSDQSESESLESHESRVVIIPEKGEAKYNNQYFKNDVVQKAIEGFTYGNNEDKAFLEIMDTVEGRILDAMYFNDSIYYLTSFGMYYCHRILLSSSAIDIDVENNTKIEVITHNFIVLSDDDGNLSVYNKAMGEKSFKKHILEGFTINDGEKLIGEDDMSFDYLHIVTNTDKSGITTKKFGKVYVPDEHLGLESEKNYKFNSELNQNVKDYVVSKNNSGLNGLVLLEDNTAFYISFYDTIYSNFREIKDVDRIFNTPFDNVFYVTKAGEKDAIYEYVFKSEDETNEIYETKIKLVSGFTTDEISNIITCREDIIFIQLENDDVYKIDNTPMYDVEMYNKSDINELVAEQPDATFIPYLETCILEYKNDIISSVSRNEQTKCQGLETAIKAGGVIKECFEVEGLDCFAMDDGYIYSFVN